MSSQFYQHFQNALGGVCSIYVCVPIERYIDIMIAALGSVHEYINFLILLSVCDLKDSCLEIYSQN